MNIVIEGANGSGKSTLIGKIVDELQRQGYNVKVVDLTKPNNDQEVAEMADEFMHNNGICIYDRIYWLSDLIYPEVYGNNPNEYVDEHKYELWELPQKVIYCSDEFEIDESPEHKRTEDELEKIISKRKLLIKRYEEVIGDFGKRGKLLKYNKDVNLSEVINFIIED